MRVVHYLPRIRLAEGGVVRAVLDICAVLAARGIDQVLATTDDTDAPQPWRDARPGTPRIHLLPPPQPFTRRLARPARASIAPLIAQADVLHLHTPWEPANIQLARIARRAGRPYVISIHGMLDDWSMAQKALKKRLFLRLTGRALLERAHCVHCTAQAEMHQAQRWYPRGRSIVIPLILDLQPYRDLPGPELARQAFPVLQSPGPIVLYLGRVHPKKGLHVLLEALSLLRRTGSTARLVVAGTGDKPYLDRIHSRIDQLNLRDAVDFLGLVTGAQKVSLYQAADLFVLPTSQENFGFTLPEALVCGTPAITTRGVDIWPELEASGGALIVDLHPQAIADAIASLLADEPRRHTMGQRGRAWVLEQLNPDAIAEQFRSLYARAANAGLKSPRACDGTPS